MKNILIISLLSLLLTGCAQDFAKLTGVCPSAGSVDRSLTLLGSQGKNATSFKANGHCLLRWRDDNGKYRKENFPVKLWAKPPFNLRLQGDIAFDPKGLVLGCNESQYWFAIRLKQISSYFWGRWEQGGGIGEVKLSPAVLLESFGLGRIEKGDWQLSGDGVFDVLTLHNTDGMAAKKIYIYNCDNRVRRIEYFRAGKIAVIVEIDKYHRVNEDFFVPKLIRVTNKENEEAETTFKIKFNLPTPMELKEVIFNRGKTRGYKHIYRIIDGKAVEQ